MIKSTQVCIVSGLEISPELIFDVCLMYKLLSFHEDHHYEKNRYGITIYINSMYYFTSEGTFTSISK